MPDLAHLNVTPERTADHGRAMTVLERDGVVVVTGVAPGAEAARDLALDLFGGRAVAVPEAAMVRDGGEKDRRPRAVDHSVRSNAHTDGFAYGDLYPDYFLLACEHGSDVGGESIVVDGYGVLDALASDPSTAWVAESLSGVAVDQTEEGMHPSVSPIVQTAPTGRRMLRRTIDQQPAPASDDPERDAETIRCWTATIDAAVDSIEASERPKPAAGEAVVIDNYRMLHGREAFGDLDRLMWRVWIWTVDGRGAPEGLLHSDSRYAPCPEQLHGPHLAPVRQIGDRNSSSSGNRRRLPPGGTGPSMG